MEKSICLDCKHFFSSSGIYSECEREEGIIRWDIKKCMILNETMDCFVKKCNHYDKKGIK
jgi:hypothetical protein